MTLLLAFLLECVEPVTEKRQDSPMIDRENKQVSPVSLSPGTSIAQSTAPLKYKVSAYQFDSSSGGPISTSGMDSWPDGSREVCYKSSGHLADNKPAGF